MLVAEMMSSALRGTTHEECSLDVSATRLESECIRAEPIDDGLYGKNDKADLQARHPFRWCTSIFQGTLR